MPPPRAGRWKRQRGAERKREDVAARGTTVGEGGGVQSAERAKERAEGGPKPGQRRQNARESVERAAGAAATSAATASGPRGEARRKRRPNGGGQTGQPTSRQAERPPPGPAGPRHKADASRQQSSSWRVERPGGGTKNPSGTCPGSAAAHADTAQAPMAGWWPKTARGPRRQALPRDREHGSGRARRREPIAAAREPRGAVAENPGKGGREEGTNRAAAGQSGGKGPAAATAGHRDDGAQRTPRQGSRRRPKETGTVRPRSATDGERAESAAIEGHRGPARPSRGRGTKASHRPRQRRQAQDNQLCRAARARHRKTTQRRQVQNRRAAGRRAARGERTESRGAGEKRGHGGPEGRPEMGPQFRRATGCANHGEAGAGSGGP